MENNNNNFNLNSQNQLNSITSSVEQTTNNNDNTNNNNNINQNNFINENNMDETGTNKNVNDSFYDAYEDDINDFYFYDLEDNTESKEDIYDKGTREYLQFLWNQYYMYRDESTNITNEIYASVDEMYKNADLKQLEKTSLKTAVNFKDRLFLYDISPIQPKIFDLICTIDTQMNKMNEQNWKKYANIKYGDLFRLSSDWLIKRCINRILTGLKNIKTWINESNEKILENRNNSFEIITEVLNRINKYLEGDELGLKSIQRILLQRKQKCLNIINESGISPGIKNRKRTTDSEDKK